MRPSTLDRHHFTILATLSVASWLAMVGLISVLLAAIQHLL